MLLTKAFKISDHEGVNELLTKYRLASGAHILVSDGQVLIPYEDGNPPNKDQQIIEIRENQNKLRSELSIIEHSNRVLDHLVADARDRVNVARAELDNKEGPVGNDWHKEATAKLAAAQNASDQLVNQKKMNEHEIARIKVNLDEYEAAIARLI